LKKRRSPALLVEYDLVRRIIAAAANESRTSRRRQATTGVNMRSRSRIAQVSWALTEAYEMDGFIRSPAARVERLHDRKIRFSSALLTLLK
jgi:hypothetical protein